MSCDSCIAVFSLIFFISRKHRDGFLNFHFELVFLMKQNLLQFYLWLHKKLN